MVSACAATPPAPQQVAQAAPQQAAPQPAAPAQASADKPVKYCQTDDETGSHIRTRTVCVTDDDPQTPRDGILNPYSGVDARSSGAVDPGK